jgi:TRAP-type C4-dicarboxylate transport system permease small subunit
MLYLWTGILAICTAQRGEEEHIKFTMFYDWLGERSKKFLDIISKSLVIIFLGISFYPTLLYIIRIKTFSPSLNIPYKYVFSVYLIAIIITIARYAFRLFQDIQSVTKKTQQQLDIK